MDHKERVHRHLRDAAGEVLAFVRSREPLHADGWVPAAEVKELLGLNLVAVPKSSKQYGERGWLFATLARMLEDEGALEYERRGSRSYCRSARS
jgi:hypothetical protein